MRAVGMMGAEVPDAVTGLLAGLGPGALVAGYRLKERIGAGGMAVVFLATDERLGRRVALKVLAPALASDDGFRRRFLRESRAAAAVDDPHIIPVYEAGESRGVLYIAMRYVPGRDVRTLLHEHGPMTAARAAAIISPVASALDAAHAAGLVHRDVKPANMLADVRPDRPDHVYLSDFGLTKGGASSAGLTGSGQFLGTPNYTAPEQIRGEPVDGRADQYALACAAYEMLTGEPPFDRDQGMAVLLAHLHDSVPPASSRRPGLQADADHVFARAMAKEPDARYRTCREFADALRTATGLPPYHTGPGPALLPGPEPLAGHAATEIAWPGTETGIPTRTRYSVKAESESHEAHIGHRTTGPAPDSTDKPDAASALGSDDWPTGDLVPPELTGVDSPAVASPHSREGSPPGSRAVEAYSSLAREAAVPDPPTAAFDVSPGSVTAIGESAPRTPSLAAAEDAVPVNSLRDSNEPGTGPVLALAQRQRRSWLVGVAAGVPLVAAGAIFAFIHASASSNNPHPGSHGSNPPVSAGSGQSASPSASPAPTITPPVSAAILTGGYTVSVSHVNWYGVNPNFRGTVSWDLTQNCKTDPCSVKLAGPWYTAILHRSGAMYRGKTTANNRMVCGSSPTITHLTF